MSTRPSSRSRTGYQDPRYLQLWLVFDWPKPTDRVPVACAECGWRGRRCRRGATVRPCPSCDGAVALGRTGRSQAETRRAGKDNVIALRGRKVGPGGGGERPAPRMANGRRVRGR